ncbi:helix-turn-helix domain-containing protein [Enterocloster sp.]|uniref:helix-turn-helix domain-containing protein n=1 Tax=Enterocloster sp. TaxID=2719315 RepID=UPI0039954A6D
MPMPKGRINTRSSTMFSREENTRKIRGVRLSGCISMTKGSCCRFFKKMTGQTLSQYLESYRISRSLSFLAEGTLSVTQVAAQVGFSNPGRFSAAFSRRMHCTPRQYGKNQTNLS